MGQFIDLVFGCRPLRLEVPADVLVDAGPQARSAGQASQQVGCDEPLRRQLRRRVAEVLRAPEQFLPITQMLVPGDHLAIALEAGLPQPEAILDGVLDVVRDSQLSRIEVVLSEHSDGPMIRNLRRSLGDDIVLSVHRGGRPSALRYLGADDDAQPIRMNRSLVDADLVLPISVMRLSDPLSGGPGTDALFPGLADAGQRWRLQQSTVQALQDQPRFNLWAAEQSHQVRWALGVQLMLAVEVTGGGQVGRLIASTPERLQQRVRSHFSDQHHRGSAPADLVIACVEGDASQQSLENLARAALAARDLATENGTVVLLSSLDSLDPPAVDGGMPEQDEPPDAMTTAEQEPDAESDGQMAPQPLSSAAFARELLWRLINQVDTSRRFLLLSACPSEAVEAFGLGALGDVSQLARLADRHHHCRVVRAAQTAPDAAAIAHAVSD